jgi:hypothetical protein
MTLKSCMYIVSLKSFTARIVFQFFTLVNLERFFFKKCTSPFSSAPQVKIDLYRVIHPWCSLYLNFWLLVSIFQWPQKGFRLMGNKGLKFNLQSSLLHFSWDDFSSFGWKRSCRKNAWRGFLSSSRTKENSRDE